MAKSEHGDANSEHPDPKTMSLLPKILALFRRSRIEHEMQNEMRAHLEDQTRRNITAGMSEVDARAAAHRQFGGVAQIQERARDGRRLALLEDLARDLKFAVRMLRKHPGFTLAATCSLALGIGANTAVFAMLHALVFRPLPFEQPEQLVEIYNGFPKVGMSQLASNVAQYLDFRANAPALDTAALWRLDAVTLGGSGDPQRITGAIATADIFPVLRVQPSHGRFFTAENHVAAADDVVVLTHAFWRSHFDGDPGVIGRTVLLDGVAHEIIGVAPPAVAGLDARVQFIRPVSWTPQQEAIRRGFSLQLLARLRLGAAVDQALAQVRALEQRHYDSADARSRDFVDGTGQIVQVDTVLAQRAGPVRASLYLLQGGVLFVLLIGSANVANLLLARFNSRRGEFAMRISLGASRTAITRQVLAECGLLVVLGAALGLGLAAVGLSVANHFASELMPAALPGGLAVPVLVWTTAITAVVGCGLGLLPAVRLLHGREADRMHLRDRGLSSARSTRGISGSLVVAQIAFALMLLTGAGLLTRSFARVLSVDPGFDSHNVFAARIAVPADKEKTFPPRLAAALQGIPEVEASLASATPFLLVPPHGVSMPLGGFALHDHSLPSGASLPSIFYCGASPSYRKTLGIPLREGRWLEAVDEERGRAVVVDEAFAAKYFPGRSAVGQRMVVNALPPAHEEDWSVIVGVVGAVRHNGVDDDSGQPFAYLPLSQMPLYGNLSVLLRSRRPAAELHRLLRDTVSGIDPALPVDRAGPLGEVIGDSFSSRRGIMLLLACLAGIAVVLAAIGIYGVLAYDVSQRTREIGVRGAIGATRGQIAALILRQGFRRTALGMVLGVAGSAALGRSIASLLFDVDPLDPTVFAVVVALLGGIAALACWIPAQRAANVDPVVALRAE